MKMRALVFASVVTLVVACGDDDYEGEPSNVTPDGGPPAASSSSSSSGSGSIGSGGLDASPGQPDCSPPVNNIGSWDPSFTLAGLTGNDGVTPKVYDFATEPDGGLLVAGYFRWAGTTRVDGLARWKDGVWSRGRADFGALPTPDAGFTAMALAPNGDLALAVSLGGSDGNDEIWLQDASGFRSIGSYANRARRMVWIGSELWVAGGVELANDGPRGLAIWDGATWHGATGGDPDGYVYDIVPDGTDVLVGGEFTEIGGVQSARIARWNGTAWSDEYGLDPLTSAYVSTLARDAGGVLHAGGLFSFAATGQGVSASLAEWTGTEWAIAGGGVTKTDGTGVVTELHLHTDGALYAAGCFDFAGGFDGDPGAVRTDSIARWDGTTWAALDGEDPFVNSPWYDFGKCGFEGSPEDIWDLQRQRLVSNGGSLIMGGSFGGIDGTPSQSIAAYTSPAWSALGANGQGLNGDVTSFAVDPNTCDLHAVVAASHVAGQPLTSRALRWTGSTWEQLGTGLPPRVRCSHLVFSGSTTLLACGILNEIDEETPTLFTLESGAWQPHAVPLVAIFEVVRAPDDAVWVAGLTADGKNELGRWNGTTLDVVEAGFDDAVLHVAFVPRSAIKSDYDVVAGGYFTTIGAVQATHIARYDGAAWHAYGAGFDSPIAAIAYANERLIAATEDDGAPERTVLAAWDGASWVDMATAANGFPALEAGPAVTVRSLQPVGARQVLVGGEIWATSGERHAYLFDGTQFRAIGGGVAASGLSAAAVTPRGYWFGGTYVAEAGRDGADERSARVPSVGVAHRALEIVSVP